MKVCDRHHDKRAKSTIVLTDTDEHVDLCDECLYEIHQFIGSDHKLEPKKKKGLVDRVKDSLIPNPAQA